MPSKPIVNLDWTFHSKNRLMYRMALAKAVHRRDQKCLEFSNCRTMGICKLLGLNSLMGQWKDVAYDPSMTLQSKPCPEQSSPLHIPDMDLGKYCLLVSVRVSVLRQIAPSKMPVWTKSHSFHYKSSVDVTILNSPAKSMSKIRESISTSILRTSCGILLPVVASGDPPGRGDLKLKRNSPKKPRQALHTYPHHLAFGLSNPPTAHRSLGHPVAKK
jgi:hypothetical protein